MDGIDTDSIENEKIREICRHTNPQRDTQMHRYRHGTNRKRKN
jgi:hypothetical protein